MPVYGGGRKRTLESRTAAASLAPSSVMNPVMKRRKAKAAGGESVLRRSNTLEEEQMLDSSIPLPSTGLK
jgi:hypothetical protein